jgi:hypothetical protein
MFPTNFFIDADKTSSTSIVATFIEKVKSLLALIPYTTKNTEKLGSNMTMGLNIMVIIGVSNRFEVSIIRCTKLKAQNLPPWWSMML